MTDESAKLDSPGPFPDITAEEARLRSPTATREPIAIDFARSWRPNTWGDELFAVFCRELDVLLTTVKRAGTEKMRAPLFVDGEFTAHSGDLLLYRINGDALSDATLEGIASYLRRTLKFSTVYAVPSEEKPPRNPAGPRLERILRSQPLPVGFPPLIVDDVLTTGTSMQELRKKHPDARGFVIFARGPCPDWITPLFCTSTTDAALKE